MIPPQSRPDLPTSGVTRGTTIRAHVGFAAKSFTASIDTKPIRAKLDVTRRVASWSATRSGIVTVFARAAGDASYVARLRVR
jgi:hypothetical protein